MSHLPPLEGAGEELVAEQDTLHAGDPAELEFDDEPVDDAVDEWPDPEGLAFYLSGPDEPPDQELRYPELENPF